MVGLVIVSHSRALALALVDLVEQVSAAQVSIAVAAGVGPERTEFGTDAVEIMEAIQSVYSVDGVLVLMDLGSAILSAEMALELLPAEMVDQVRFCAAPLVEGAIAAAVQAGLGANLDSVCREAQTALVPKIEHIEGPEAKTRGAMPREEVLALGEDTITDRLETILTLANLHGLHARPAARFVQTAASFDADVQVKNLTNDKGPVSAMSLNGVATLGAVRDHQILITATGPEASQALEALSKLVGAGFGETNGDIHLAAETLVSKKSVSIRTSTEGVRKGGFSLKAVAVSKGYVLGPLYRYGPPLPPIPSEPADDPGKEWARLEAARAITQRSIHLRRVELTDLIGEEEAQIFDAHLLILQDPELIDIVRGEITEQNKNAAAAWDAAIKQTAAAYTDLDDPYLQQRSADVLDVGGQVLFALAGRSEIAEIPIETPVVLYAHDLTPTETSQLDMNQVLGILTSVGGPTSHSAILARALGIPSVSGVGAALNGVGDNTRVALDGFSGHVWVKPNKSVTSMLEDKRDEWLARRQRLIEAGSQPAATLDGVRIEVAANVGSVEDTKAAIRNGAEGIGLLRTEFLFLSRDSSPTEEEQVDVLSQIGEVMRQGGAKGPVIVRTLDVGGDKNLPYVNLPEEANPFLGVRAIRLSLRNQQMFNTQLRAALRAGANNNIKIMFPMISILDELRQAKVLLEEAHLSLEKESLAHKWPIETGMMVEVPGAAILSKQFAKEVDFFSIGTNDLTQYTLAAERGNPNLAEMSDALHPAVLRLVQQVVEAAHQHSKWVGVCGEMAGDPLGAAVLLGLGVDELSMSPGAIPALKSVLRRVTMKEAKALAIQAVEMESAAQVRLAAEAMLGDRTEELAGSGFWQIEIFN